MASRLRSSRGALLLSTLVLVGVACASARSRPGIALNRRIGSASLLETETQVAKTLGRGTATTIHDFRGIVYQKVGLTVGYARDPQGQRRALSVETHSSRYRTAGGIGVGSTLKRLKRSISVKCYG